MKNHWLKKKTAREKEQQKQESVQYMRTTLHEMFNRAFTEQVFVATSNDSKKYTFTVDTCNPNQNGRVYESKSVWVTSGDLQIGHVVSKDEYEKLLDTEKRRKAKDSDHRRTC